MEQENEWQPWHGRLSNKVWEEEETFCSQVIEIEFGEGEMVPRKAAVSTLALDKRVHRSNHHELWFNQRKEMSLIHALLEWFEYTVPLIVFVCNLRFCIHSSVC